eukprot:3042092-Alexandrium_andersonii.AAC.1
MADRAPRANPDAAQLASSNWAPITPRRNGLPAANSVPIGLRDARPARGATTGRRADRSVPAQAFT